VQHACDNASALNCRRAAQSKFHSTASLIGKCYEDCPIECDELRYDLTVSASSYPTKWYANVLANNTKFNSIINAYFSLINISFINYTNQFTELKNSIACVNIYYEDLRFTEVQDDPAMDYIALLGVLGGNLALFLG
jgi:hypothetical protein